MSDYLDDEEQLARMKSWWDENGTSTIVAVVIGIAGVIGWDWYGDYSVEERQAQTALLTGYQSADEADKARLAGEIGNEFSGSAAHVLALFDQARIAIEAGEAEQAAELLNQAIQESGDELLVDLGRIRLAKVQQQLDLSSQALSTLSQVRNEGFRSLALEVQGDIHAANGDVEQAYLAYQSAVDSLPEGDQRPLLSLKLENAKPFNGEFVQMTDTITEALKQAAETLEVQMPTEEGSAPADGEEGES